MSNIGGGAQAPRDHRMSCQVPCLSEWITAEDQTFELVRVVSRPWRRNNHSPAWSMGVASTPLLLRQSSKRGTTVR